VDGQELAAPQPDQEQAPVDKSQIYWALWQGKDLADALDDKQQAYFQTARNRGLLALWVLAYAAHHGLTPEDLRDFATQAIGFSGDELELLRFHINLVRTYVRQQTSLALGEDAAFKAMVTNSDHRSQAKAELSDEIVTAQYKRYSAEHDVTVAESDGCFGAGFAHYRWDFVGGDEVTIQQQVMGPDGQPTQHPVKAKSGAPIVTPVYPWAAIQETRMSGDPLWILIRETDNKWNLIASFPGKREEILQVSQGSDEYDFGTLFRLEDLEIANKDLCTVKHFYHARCAAMPEGRYCVIYGDVILWDGPSPVKEGLPVAEMCSGRFIETTFGYADAWDLLAIQQALNQVNSDELQNYATYGKQSIGIEKGTEVTLDAIAKGTAFYIPQGAQMPKAVQLTAIPTTLPTLKDYLHKQLDTVSGQNAASRGDPDPNVRSGEMNALLHSIAIGYQSFRQKAARKFRIRGATIIVDMITRYGQTPFLVSIAGIEKRSYVAEFTADDLDGIERITMDEVSPMMQSVAGRMQIYQLLKDVPPEDRGPAYEMITTGNSSAFMATDRSSDMLIRRENEDLVTGERPVVVNADDDPFKHYPKHKAQREMLLASDNPDVEAIGRINQHLLEHQQQYIGLQPIIAAFCNIQPPPAIPGNPTWQMQMLMAQSGGAMPSPEQQPGAAQGGGGSAPAQKPQPGGPNGTDSAGSAQRQSTGQGGQQVDPSGTKLPSPSQPAQPPS
jgi:hypothetical protein